MDPDLKNAIDRLKGEVGKDIYFFGASGFVVGVFMVWQFRLQELGLTKKVTWSADLFNDFVSFNAFAFIFYAYLLLSCARTVVERTTTVPAWLASIVLHVETRLTEIASSILCFLIGLTVYAAIFSFFTLEAGGLKLALLICGFCLFTALSYLSAYTIGNRVKPFDKWWVALISFIVLTVSVVYLLTRAAPQQTGDCQQKPAAQVESPLPPSPSNPNGARPQPQLSPG
jgi:hypothetical protein